MTSCKTTVLFLCLLLGAPGCERETASRGPGPYSLHCSEAGSQPTCIRFHSPTGAIRRLDLARVAQGKADPDSSRGGSVYALTCRDFGLPHGESGKASIQCLRLDTYSGEVLVVDATTAPKAL